MIANWRVSAILSSPLAGEAPYLDAMLEWEMAFRLGIKSHKKLTRDTKLCDVSIAPIPLAKRTVAGYDVYCCSDPILPEPSAEWIDYSAKRLDTNMLASLLMSNERKSISVTSGAYKMRRAPIRVRLIDRVSWFFRGDKREVRKILLSINSIGAQRKIGYGIIKQWEFEQVEDDYSIWAKQGSDTVLMKTIPVVENMDRITGFRLGFGGYKPPYWHPENYREIAIPC